MAGAREAGAAVAVARSLRRVTAAGVESNVHVIVIVVVAVITIALPRSPPSFETALARADEKISALTERNGHLEADVQVSRTNIEKRVEDLNSALQRERMERAVVEGALEAARKDNSRLQSEVGALRSTLRRGAPLEEMQAPPPAEVETDADVVDQDEEKPTRAKAKQS